VLIISGQHDIRRDPRHGFQVADQLCAANAPVTHHALDAGHGWTPNDDDFTLTRR
jgi:phospholipase/carboxylesterase